jgi:hypothetical protein
VLPAFASIEDLEARLPGGLSGDDTERAQAALADAASLIRAETSKAYVNEDGDLDLPTGADAWRADTLVRVNLSAAVRALVNPDGVKAEQIVSYRYELGNDSPDVYLTASEKRAVRKAAGLVGLAAVATTRGPLETPGPGTCGAWATAETYLPVSPAGSPIPFE